jgi:hypothetical protein
MATKETYTGECEFCHTEIDKSKMTQHLKSCKQRKADLAAEAAKHDDTQEKTKFFHLVVEGKYLPMYWMHLEVPATDTLDDLDSFLRDTWLECCGHLSAFQIADVSYMSQTDDDNMFFNLTNLDIEDDDDDDEEEDDEDEVEDTGADEVESQAQSLQLDTPNQKPVLRLVEDLAVDEDEDLEDEDEEDEEDSFDLDLENMSPMELAQNLSELLTNEFGINVAQISAEEFKEKLLEIFATQLNAEAGTQVELPSELREQVETMAPLLHTLLMFPPLMNMLEADEDGEQDMDVELGDVLEVGQKFSYEYDFGSTTELSLRVVGEREGYLPQDEDVDENADEDEDEDVFDVDDDDEDEGEDEEYEEYESNIHVLAQNLPPVIPCRECGKPATQVESGFFNVFGGALCDECTAKLDEDEREMLLPIVNSPRTGVCAYVG